MIKPDYILLREKKDGVILSSMSIEVPVDFDVFLKDKSFTLKCSESTYSPETDINYQNKIYQTKQGFFLYLSLTERVMIVYYLEDQINELTIFIRQLFKQFKNNY